MSDELILTVGGQNLAGWIDTSVTLSMEQCPNSFRIVATEASPLYSDAIMVQPGQPCTVQIGQDTAITGYVDAVAPGYDASSHTVTIQGRGKCQDLADCSSEWPGSQLSQTSALDIATKLAQPYGITASLIGPPGLPIRQFNINIGDTPLQVLELVSRNAQLLYYEDVNGNLVLAQAGATNAASGFTEGQNVQAASYIRSINGRYSQYAATLLSVFTGPIFEGGHDGQFFGQATDPNVTRNRKLFFVAEGVMGSQQMAVNRAQWECNRRYGRSLQVSLTTDSWRDSAGKLWMPNTLAPVTLPRLQLPNTLLCISTVTFKKSEATGKTADVVLMPKQAFLPEPIQLQPVIPGATSTGPSNQPSPTSPQAVPGA